MLLTFVDFFLKLDFSQPEAIITQLFLSSVLANLHGNYVNGLCTAEPVDGGGLQWLVGYLGLTLVFV